MSESKYFIEIGTSDFDTFEHLAEKGWKGIFVEPVKELLDNLKRYDGCIYENCAVLDKMDTMTLKYYDPEWAEGWRRGVGSISPINIFNLHPSLQKHELTREVDVVTLDYLIKKHNVKKIDYLKIDIEGLEYRILDDYSWDIKPDTLKVEHKHWRGHWNGTGRGRKNNITAYIKKLESMGYSVTRDLQDLMAVLK